MKIAITKPCNENWETMKIGLHSRHCMHCEKDVVDFTKMSKQQIIEFISTKKEVSTCGRFLQHQLDYHISEPLILIRAIEEKYGKTNISRWEY
ncbi:MAG: hypothetical protein GC181_10500 [Bacteroidetes bacterium]|nr:hypothetical protein [Bacteroidota bacterium]